MMESDFIMKKYKLYKEEKNLITRQFNFIYEEDYETSIARSCGFLLGSICFGIVHKCIEDDNFFLAAQGFSLAAMAFEWCKGNIKAKKSDDAFNKIRNLESVLRKKGLNIDLLSYKEIIKQTINQKESEIYVLENNDRLIYCDENYYYLDTKKNTKHIITDEVSECLLTKRKAKKYKKSKQNK